MAFCQSARVPQFPLGVGVARVGTLAVYQPKRYAYRRFWWGGAKNTREARARLYKFCRLAAGARLAAERCHHSTIHRKECATVATGDVLPSHSACSPQVRAQRQQVPKIAMIRNGRRPLWAIPKSISTAQPIPRLGMEKSRKPIKTCFMRLAEHQHARSLCSGADAAG